VTFPGIEPIMRFRVSKNHDTRPTRLFLVVAAVLALLAMINVIGVSNWHNSMADHDDGRVASALVQQDEGGKSLPDIDLHATAHSVIHGLADIMPSIGMAIAVFVVANLWFIIKDYALSGLPPEALLRPPRD